MTKETLLIDNPRCLSALKSIANIHKPFEKTFYGCNETSSAIPDPINFLQLGKIWLFLQNKTIVTFLSMKLSNTTLRRLYHHKYLTGKRKAITFPIPNQAGELALDRLFLVWLWGITSADWKSWASVSLTSTNHDFRFRFRRRIQDLG